MLAEPEIPVVSGLVRFLGMRMRARAGLPTFSGKVELASTWKAFPTISHVVFDFDGTLSWLRHGWPEIMVQLLQEHFPARAEESPEQVHDFLMTEILRFNGRPTIFQMLHFVELVASRSGPQYDAEALRQEYQRRLDVEIEHRSQLIRSGQAKTDDFVVHGARALLEFLSNAAIRCIVLSSTVEERVREEAALLDLTRYFGDRIYGGRGDPTKFSKRAVFESILNQDRISGEQLCSFGDGPVEIADTKVIGGLAVAVCSDETINGSGEYDAFKYRQLLAAGADAAIPDFRDAIPLFQFARNAAV